MRSYGAYEKLRNAVQPVHYWNGAKRGLLHDCIQLTNTLPDSSMLLVTLWSSMSACCRMKPPF